jgi:predicted kinase
MANVVIITGLECSGKKTLAKALAASVEGAVRIDEDSLRYISPSWTKRSAAEFLVTARAAIKHARAEHGLVVLDTTYYDGNDLEHARRQLTDVLLAEGVVKQLIVFQPVPKEELLTALMQRSLDRAAERVPDGAAKESAHNIVQLLLKNDRCYSSHVEALGGLARKAFATTVPVLIGSRATVYAALGL